MQGQGGGCDRTEDCMGKCARLRALGSELPARAGTGERVNEWMTDHTVRGGEAGPPSALLTAFPHYRL